MENCNMQIAEKGTLTATYSTKGEYSIDKSISFSCAVCERKISFELSEITIKDGQVLLEYVSRSSGILADELFFCGNCAKSNRVKALAKELAYHSIDKQTIDNEIGAQKAEYLNRKTMRQEYKQRDKNKIMSVEKLFEQLKQNPELTNQLKELLKEQ